MSELKAVVKDNFFHKKFSGDTIAILKNEELEIDDGDIIKDGIVICQVDSDYQEEFFTII